MIQVMLLLKTFTKGAALLRQRFGVAKYLIAAHTAEAGGVDAMANPAASDYVSGNYIAPNTATDQTNEREDANQFIRKHDSAQNQRNRTADDTQQGNIQRSGKLFGTLTL